MLFFRNGFRIALLLVVAALINGCATTRLLLSRVSNNAPSPADDVQPCLPEVPSITTSSLNASSGTHGDVVLTDATEYSETDFAVSRVSFDQSTETMSAVEAFTLPELEQLALDHNPTLQQLSAAVQKARSLRYQVGLKPNPVVGYSGGQLFDAGTDQHVAFVEQEIVTGDKLCLNRRVLDQSVQVQLWELETQRKRVVTDVRRLFFAALAAQRREKLTNLFQVVVQKGVDVSKQRLQALEGSQVDVLQSEIQLAEVELKQQQAQISFNASWKELAAIAGLPHLNTAAVTGDLTPRVLELDWEQTYQSLLAVSPELHAARTRVTEARMNQRRQEVQAVPNPTLLVGAGSDNGTGTGMLNVQVGLPLPVHNKNAGNISAAWADYCRATHEVKRIESSMKARLARVAGDFDSAAATVRRYQDEILPRAEQTLRLSEQAYAAGEFDFLQVLIVRRTFFESNLIHVQALGELAQAHAQVDGILLTGALDATVEFTADDTLRQQSFSQQ